MNECLKEALRIAAVDVEIKVYGIYCSPCCNYFENEDHCSLFRVKLKRDEWNVLRYRGCKKSEIDTGADFKPTVRIKSTDKK